jgi:hypothetical protein
MPRRLNLFTNELDKEQPKQNEQINLAIQEIQNWGKTIRNTVSLVLGDDTAQSTTSTNFVIIPNWANSIKTTNPTIRVDVTICINVAGNIAYLALVLDGAIQRQIKLSSAGENIISFSEVITTNVGLHEISIQWKTATGTINKIQDGGSKVIVTNMV